MRSTVLLRGVDRETQQPWSMAIDGSSAFGPRIQGSQEKAERYRQLLAELADLGGIQLHTVEFMESVTVSMMVVDEPSAGTAGQGQGTADTDASSSRARQRRSRFLRPA